MATEITMSRVRAYQAARNRLLEARNTEFKPGRAVRVSNERCHGYGLIVTDESCPLDQIAVRLESGNTWWYPLEDCSIARRDACPHWLQDAMSLEPRTTVKPLTARTEVHR